VAALQQFTSLTGIQVTLPPNFGAGLNTAGIDGTFTPEALTRLLTGTRLTLTYGQARRRSRWRRKSRRPPDLGTVRDLRRLV
jgi:hypothetical protein